VTKAYLLLEIEKEAGMRALRARKLNLVPRLPYDTEVLVKPTF
jgi:hypothetical protein